MKRYAGICILKCPSRLSVTNHIDLVSTHEMLALDPSISDDFLK